MFPDLKDFEILQNAKEAGYLESKLKPMFDEIEGSILSKLKSDYRSESKNEVDLRVSIGILCAIEDLENMLLRQINKARTIERNLTQ